MESLMYVVTGATGFLGGTVCRKLVAQQQRVRTLVLPGDKARKFIPEEVEIVEGDLCDAAAVEHLLDVEGPVVVIHCASIVTVNPDYNPRVMAVNVDGTHNVVNACLAHQAGHRLVYVSSTGAIPEQPKGTPIREVTHFSEGGLVDCYSQSKALATQLVLDACGRGLNACVVHPTGIMGPGDEAVGTTTHTFIQIIKGEMPMGIDGSFNLADVRDLADGVLAAASHGRQGECYILGNDDILFRDFASVVAAESGCKPIGRFLSCRMAHAIAWVAERWAKLTHSQPLMTTFSVYNLARNNVFDSSKAQRELGYHTRPYSETIADEVAWLRQVHLI